MSKLKAYLDILRPINSLMMGFAVIVGYFIATQGQLNPLPYHKLVLGFFTGFFLTASSMVLNDYFDKEIDAVNAPYRPIPSGLISSREAIVYAVLLSLAGLIFSLLINQLCFLLALSSFTVSSLYNALFKRTGLLGNFMVSFCVAIPFIFGAAVADGINIVLLILSIMVFLSNTAREIIKGIADVEGDRMRGVLTLAVRYGGKYASKVAFLFFILAILLSPIPYILGVMGYVYLVLVFIADFGFIYSSIKLVGNPSKHMALKVKKQILLWMFIGLLAFLFGTISA